MGFLRAFCWLDGEFIIISGVRYFGVYHILGFIIFSKYVIFRPILPMEVIKCVKF